MTGAVIMMGGLGLLVGIGLAIASKVFYVYVDPLIMSIDDVLPGANCGGCGLPGCSANAEAIVQGKATPDSCVAAGDEVTEQIAGLLGVTIEAKEPDIAKPGCYYGVQDADLKYFYNGLGDCRAAALLGGGMKICSIGCLGLGTCRQACPFDAITMGPDNLPVVDEEKCTGCGTCERVCPKNIINLSSITRRVLREYTTEECTTPCQRACPAGINIREYVLQISKGNHQQAVQVIKERNPFPTVIGRICPRPCEEECRRKYVDEPVAINFLKRYCADVERSDGSRTLPYKAPDTGRKVAVIGGGVEGLSAAFFSARLGHDTTVLEATEQMGGLLRSAIAANRLPSDILDWDIDGVREMGVTLETGKMLGRDFTINSLLEDGFQAVFTAIGGWDSRLARDAAATLEQPLPGMYLLVDFLKAGSGGEKVDCGKNVLIAGGGSLAAAAARSCKASGADNVTILYRESADQNPAGPIDIGSMEESGIQVQFQTGIGRLFGEAGQLTDIETIDLNTGETERIAVQTLILAAGRFPEMIYHRKVEAVDSENESEAVEEMPAGPVRWEAFAPYKKPADIEERGLFATGDALTDYSAAIKAIAAGRRGAASIHQAMYDIPLTFPSSLITPTSLVQNVDAVAEVGKNRRQIMPLCGPAEPCREIEKGFDTEMAKSEADRCLQCGLICYQHTGIPAPVQDADAEKVA